MDKFDLHIHTQWSDGTNNVREVIEYANFQKLHAICISDHYSKQSFKISEVIDNPLGYVADIHNVPSTHTKTLAGLEIDTKSIESFDHITELPDLHFLLFEYGVDFMGLYPEIKRKDTLEVIQRIIDFKTSCNIPICLSHPYFASLSESEFKNISKLLLEHQIIIELNDYYRNYDDFRFLELLNAGIPFSIGTNAHRIQSIGKTAFIIEYLKTNLSEELQKNFWLKL